MKFASYSLLSLSLVTLTQLAFAEIPSSAFGSLAQEAALAARIAAKNKAHGVSEQKPKPKPKPFVEAVKPDSIEKPEKPQPEKPDFREVKQPKNVTTCGLKVNGQLPAGVANAGTLEDFCDLQGQKSNLVLTPKLIASLSEPITMAHAKMCAGGALEKGDAQAYFYSQLESRILDACIDTFWTIKMSYEMKRKIVEAGNFKKVLKELAASVVCASTELHDVGFSGVKDPSLK